MTAIPKVRISSGRLGTSGRARLDPDQGLAAFLAEEWPHLPRGTAFAVLPTADLETIVEATRGRPLLDIEHIAEVRIARGPRNVVRTAFLRGFLSGLWAAAALTFLAAVLRP